MPDIQLGPYQALLFDMDGTLLSSTAAIGRVWNVWSARWGLDAAEVTGFLHGRRAMDAVDHFLPHLDAGQRTAEIDWVETREIKDTKDVLEVPGAGAFLATLPANRWAIVTSAARRLALARITAAGLPLPDLLIAAEDVPVGKPDPSGYRLAAKILGKEASECLIFEDAAAGIQAGKASGADVLVIGDDPTAERFSGTTRIADFSDLVCEHASNDTLRLRSRQLSA